MSIQLKLVSGEEARKLDPAQIPWPIDSLVIFAFNDDDQVVGRIGTFQITAIEGSWIHPDYRSGTLAVRLTQGIEKVIADLGKTTAMAMSAEETVSGYLTRLGYNKLPVEVFTKELAAKQEAA